MKLKDNYLLKISEIIKDTLAKPEKELFTKAVDNIIIHNEDGQDIKSYAILFNGIKYKHSSLSPNHAKGKTLQLSLVDGFSKVLKQWRTVESDMQQIWQALLPLICTPTQQTIRNSLPEELIQCVKELNVQKRTVPHIEILEKLTTRELSQYQKMLPKLHYYISLKMLI